MFADMWSGRGWGSSAMGVTFIVLVTAYIIAATAAARFALMLRAMIAARRAKLTSAPEQVEQS